MNCRCCSRPAMRRRSPCSPICRPIPLDPKLKIEGHLSQRTSLVRGQNNSEVWGHTDDRMAIAVTNEVPFKIDIVQPKVPLVKNGSMNLKIVATRAAGFTAPISVSLLYNPPGVSSSGSVNIPEKQNEAVIPLTANGGAPIRKWKIVAIGRAPFAGATVEAASQLAELEIADQYLNLGFPRAAVEKGKEVDYVVNVEKKKDFDGEATVELLGLPAGTTTRAGQDHQEFDRGVVQREDNAGSAARQISVAGVPRDDHASGRADHAHAWARANCESTNRCRRSRRPKRRREARAASRGDGRGGETAGEEAAQPAGAIAAGETAGTGSKRVRLDRRKLNGEERYDDDFETKFARRCVRDIRRGRLAICLVGDSAVTSAATVESPVRLPPMPTAKANDGRTYR